MGLYDREYARGSEPGMHLGGPQSLTNKLVILTFGVYVLQLVFDSRSPVEPQPIANALALSSEWYRTPWHFYQLLTYGFLHSRTDVAHILINMLVLWMFGQEIERRYGSRAFLGIYLSAIVFAGLGWSVIEAFYQTRAALLGASGGISAIFALYALNFPQRKVLFLFIIPMPMWVAALICLFIDAQGAISRSGNVAFTAHLSGALYGLYFYKLGWNPGLWIMDRFSGLSLKPKPKLRVHTPDDAPGGEMSEQVDAILEKIQREGQDSLSWRERKILESASRKYQERRR